MPLIVPPERTTLPALTEYETMARVPEEAVRAPDMVKDRANVTVWVYAGALALKLRLVMLPPNKASTVEAVLVPVAAPRTPPKYTLSPAPGTTPLALVESAQFAPVDQLLSPTGPTHI